MPSPQDQLHNLQGLVQNKNAGPLIQKLSIISKPQQQNVKTSTGPVRAQAPGNCTGCTPVDLALPLWQQTPIREKPRTPLQEQPQPPQPEKMPSFSSTENDEWGRNEPPFGDISREDGASYTHTHYTWHFHVLHKTPEYCLAWLELL